MAEAAATTDAQSRFRAKAEEFAAFREDTGRFPRTRATRVPAAERKLGHWLRTLRVRSLLKGLKDWQYKVLDEAIPGWDSTAPDDWYSDVLLLRAMPVNEEGIRFYDREDDEELEKGDPGPDERQRLDALVDRWQFGLFWGNIAQDKVDVLDRLVPEWEEEGRYWRNSFSEHFDYLRVEYAKCGGDLAKVALRTETRASEFLARSARKYVNGNMRSSNDVRYFLESFPEFERYAWSVRDRSMREVINAPE